MPKSLFAAVTLVIAFAATPVTAQQALRTPACPSGTTAATLRHSVITPGQWKTFQQAVVDHTAWYESHGDTSRTRLIRILDSNATGLSEDEAVTMTVYSGTPQARDAAYAAFVSKYKASSTMKDEVRICLPTAMAR